MKDRLTVGEFAKLKNITAETLRYYDRVGLFKPETIDENTGYRYYSIRQYEKLGTILELRQLGMSIDEIKKYFDNRNLNQSITLLKEKYEELKEKIKELEALEKSTKEKIKHLEFVSKVNESDEIIIKEIEERYIITFDRVGRNDVELSYLCLGLENELNEIAPIVGTNRYGAIIEPSCNDEDINTCKSFKVFIFLKSKENINKEKLKIIKGGKYVCMYYKGIIYDVKQKLDKMFEFINKNGYEICGDIIQIIQIDISVTDRSEEELFEIQIPIK
ncbi:MerR family transcriptional regulator [Clostridium sp.]|uniref:MerR family transcriptional regulator n=1 Tax=Clostridium sp. TaxID=1506 RepID=UPI002625FA66|nr:MerR family transcriptional regulator [Clostridium sp.]